MKISFLLLGPHISHIVLVVFEAHLRGSSTITNSTWFKLVMHRNICDSTSNALQTWILQTLHVTLYVYSFTSRYNLRDSIYLVQSDPVPGAAREVGRNFEFGCGISNTIPLILHDECDQGNIHLVRELRRTFSINIYTEQKHCKIHFNDNEGPSTFWVVTEMCAQHLSSKSAWSHVFLSLDCILFRQSSCVSTVLSPIVIFTMYPDVSHLQGKDGGDWFVVTDSEFHVTSVVVLCHFGPAGQPWNGATLPCTQSCVGRCGGSQAPQDPVSPSWFTLLPTWRGTRKRVTEKREKRKKPPSCLKSGEKKRRFHAPPRLMRTFHSGEYEYYWATLCDI